MQQAMWVRLACLACCCTVATASQAGVFDVYIAAGQSNMDGRGLRSELNGPLAAYREPQPDVLLHYTRPNGSTTTQSGWVSLAPGYSMPPSTYGGDGSFPSPTFGPEVSFGKALHDGADERQVAIIKVSRGGTNLHTDWRPAGDKGFMYAGFENAIDQAIQALHAQGHSVEIRGVIWHQGESDNSTAQSAYEANLTNFIQTVRHDLDYPHLPFLIGELESVDGGREAVRTAQANVAAAMDFVEFVPSTGLAVADGTHFTTASVIELGERFAAAMQSTVSQLAGDFNRDGVVDIDDFHFWSLMQGSTIDARADANHDGIVDEADLQIWQAAVPEPPTHLITVVAAIIGGFWLVRTQYRSRAARAAQA